MAQFINARDAVVTDAIDGALLSAGGRLARLDGYPHLRVVLRRDWDKSRVALVSGGGSGHEPAHVGFVGAGMLTAAVCGDVFTSPSVDAVLAGILAVTGPAGCLLIVKNYTGDRLNFGLAAERARALGLKVSMVIIGDDVALPDLAQPRGLAGTLLVHKLAGAKAETGATLEAVTETALRVIAGTKSLGMSLDTCSVPGSPKEQRIAVGKAELGLGIHGEPGVQQIDYRDAAQAMAAVTETLAAQIGTAPHVAILNNLGGTSVLEMSILAKELMTSALTEHLQYLVGPAAMMTALDMRGFSVTVYPLTAEDEALLLAPAAPAAWPGCQKRQPFEVVALPEGLKPAQVLASADAGTEALLTRCCTQLIAAEADLNALDAKSGDGDTGSTLAGAARALLGALPHLPLADHPQLYRAIGQELSQTMGGSSGVLLAIFFTAAGEAATSGQPMVAALQAGLDRMQQIGGAQLGDRTMVDALKPALAVLALEGLAGAARAARQGADHTATIVKAKAGRASYISAGQLQGHIDPGAEAVARLFEHLSATSPREAQA